MGRDDANDHVDEFEEDTLQLEDLDLGGALTCDSDKQSEADSDVDEDSAFDVCPDCDDDDIVSDSETVPPPDELDGHGCNMASATNDIHSDHGDADYPADCNWQAVVDNLFKPKWPNNNWSLLSRLLNILGSTDRDADVLIDTIRQIDWTTSIPNNVAELRKVERDSLGTNE